VTENFHVLYKDPLIDKKVGVWHIVNTSKIIGLIFFYDTVSSELYVNNTEGETN